MTSAPRGASTLSPPDAEELAARLEAVEAACARADLDGLIVWSRGATGADCWADVLYLTNHTTAVTHIADSAVSSAHGYCAVVIRPGSPTVLVTDSYDVDPTQVHAGEVRVTGKVDLETAAVARELGLAGGRVGIVGASSLLHVSYARIAEALGPQTRMTPADDIFTRLRAAKSAHEVALLREASRIGCEWIEVMLNACEPGRTEGEVVGEGLRYLAAAGGWPFDVAISSGPGAGRYRNRQALPTWDSSRRLEAGDLVHIDAWGPMVHGYYCDLTRSTVVQGRPSPAQERLLEDSIGMIEHLISGVEPGVRLSALHARGMEWLSAHGGGGSAFSEVIPFVGHSLGLEVEAPFITGVETMTVQAGMVLALECFIGDGATSAAGFEHVVAVTSDDVEVLTASARSRPWA